MLAGFAKTSKLAPGATAELTIHITAESLATWDPVAKEYLIERGVEYKLVVGEDSEVENVVIPFTIE